MHRIPNLELPALLLLLMSVGNVYLVGRVFLLREAESAPQLMPSRNICGTAAIILSAQSQLLYLVFFAMWTFRWMRFYPGNPVQHYFFVFGLLLSGAGLLMSPFGIGVKRWVSLCVAATTGMMWLLAAIVSSAV